jgi:3-methyladenine DNA glycosylase/8-oxoguanine DNA glycosylase
MRKIELKKATQFKLTPTAPFSFETTFHKPSHFPTPDRKYSSNTFWQSLLYKGNFYGVVLKSAGTIESTSINGILFHNNDINPEMINEIKQELSFRFDLQAELSEFMSLAKKDNLLSQALKTEKGMRVSTPYSLYEFLVITTVLQNTTVRRSVQMMENLFMHFGALLKFDEVELYAFWEPGSIEKCEEEELRSLKLGYRAKILKRQAPIFKEPGDYESSSLKKLSKEQLRKKLLDIYGVGPASVQYILFEVFHFYDACEYLPPWEQKIYSKLLFSEEIVDSKKILEQIDLRWGRWKMLAMHYIFEDLFRKHQKKNIPWLKELIRL